MTQQETFAEFLYMFLDAADFDQEYTYALTGDGSFEIRTLTGDLCSDQRVYDQIQPQLDLYGYQFQDGHYVAA